MQRIELPTDTLLHPMEPVAVPPYPPSSSSYRSFIPSNVKQHENGDEFDPVAVCPTIESNNSNNNNYNNYLTDSFKGRRPLSIIEEESIPARYL